MILLTADAEPTDIVLVPNATTGINTVVQSLIKTFHTGDSIFSLSLTYGTVFKLSVCGNSLPGSFLKDLRGSDMIGGCFISSSAGAVKKLLKHVATEHGFRVDEVTVRFPLQSTHEVILIGPFISSSL